MECKVKSCLLILKLYVISRFKCCVIFHHYEIKLMNVYSWNLIIIYLYHCLYFFNVNLILF